jgi:hypothetical protein
MADMNSAVKNSFKYLPTDPKSELICKSSGGKQMHSCNVSEIFSSVVNKLKLNDMTTDKRQKVVS